MKNSEQHKRMQKFVREFSAQRGFPLPEDPNKKLVWYRNCNNFLFDIIDEAHFLSDQINRANSFRSPDHLTKALNNLTTHCLTLSSIGAAGSAAIFGHRLLLDVDSDDAHIRQCSEAGLRILKDAAAKGDSETSYFLHIWYKHRAPKDRMGREEKAKRYLTNAGLNKHRQAAYIFARGFNSGHFPAPKEMKDEKALTWFTQALAKRASGSLTNAMVRSSLREIKKLVASPAIDPNSKVAKKARKILHRYTAG